MIPIIPAYQAPDFNGAELADAPAAKFVEVTMDGVVPDNYHGTTNHPEYVHLGGGEWLLAPESRMDGVLVLKMELWMSLNRGG